MAIKLSTASYAKIATSITGLALIASLGMSGMASADRDGSSNSMQLPANITQCKHQYRQFGFRNQGQCVSYYNMHKSGYGYGYGGNRGNHHHFSFGNFFKNFSHFFGFFHF